MHPAPLQEIDVHGIVAVKAYYFPANGFKLQTLIGTGTENASVMFGVCDGVNLQETKRCFFFSIYPPCMSFGPISCHSQIL